MWRRRLGRTALAAVVMGLIGLSIWLALQFLPAYRDVWLVLAGVLGAGAVGAWRADIEADAREREYRREVELRRLDDTLRYVQEWTDHLSAFSDALASGQQAPIARPMPRLTDLLLAGDAAAVTDWLRITAEVNRFEPMTPDEAARLADAHSRLSRAITDQRFRLWQRQPLIRLTAAETERIATIQEEGIQLQQASLDAYLANLKAEQDEWGGGTTAPCQ